MASTWQEVIDMVEGLGRNVDVYRGVLGIGSWS